ncbi:MAG: tyrosine-type recombinase/integrase [Candidatus Thermoplasmatota archaeon]
MNTEQQVQEQVERFEAFLRAEKRTEATATSYTRSLRLCLEFIGKPVLELQKADMQAWKAHLAEKYCENTMCSMLAAVNCYTSQVIERHDLRMKLPKQVEKEKVPLTEEEVRRVLDEAKRSKIGENGFQAERDTSLRDYALICLMYYGGLRASEAIGVRVANLDLDKKRLRVHAGKGKDYSFVNLSDEAVQAVARYLKAGRPAPESGYEDYVFLTEGRRPMTRRNLWMMVKKTAFRAGIEKNVHPHIFRHSMITHMAESGLSASFIQAQSRHKSLDDVQRYTHLSEKSRRQAYDRAFGGESASVSQRALPEEDAGFGAESIDEGPERSDRIRDMILLKYLNGEISDEKLERLVSLVEHRSMKEGSTSWRMTPGYY